MKLSHVTKKLYIALGKKLSWIASSCFSASLQNHPRKDAKCLTQKQSFFIFASNQTKQSRRYIWNTLKPILFVLVFLVIGIGSFGNPTFVHAIPDDGNSAASLQTTKQGQFIPLVGIPYIKDPNQVTSLSQYINALYKISITIAAFLAVVKIIFAGVKYMLSDVVTTKEDAKKDIKGALLGLLIVVGAVLILNTINPNLTSLTALEGIQGVGVRLENNYSNTELYSGPTSCPTGESLTLRSVGSGIIRTCTPYDQSYLTDDIPTQDDASPGYTLQQQSITFPCAGVCNTPNDPGNITGASSGEAECNRLSNGTGQFNITGVGVGLCSWEIPDN